MNDDGKPQNDMTQHDAQAYELIELLNLLEAVDHRITPGHVTKRFRELLNDIDDGGQTGAAADGHPREVPGQIGGDDQITSMRQEGDAERHAYLAGLYSSLEAAIADAQSKAKAAADELRRAEEANTAARQQAERIVAEARAQGDLALEQAATTIRNARNQARRIRGEAEGEAEQIVSAADDRADEALQQAAKMIRDARQQSERIISEARREIEQVRGGPGGTGFSGNLTGADLTGLTGLPGDLESPEELSAALGAYTGLAAASPLTAETIGRIAAAVTATLLAGPGSSRFTPGVNAAERHLIGQDASQDMVAAVPPDRPTPAPAATFPADGQICTVMAVDIVGFTRPDRDDDIRRYLHEQLYGYLRKAFDDSGIPWAECFCEDRGDGMLIVVPPEISAKGIIDPMPERLRRLVGRHNHISRAAAGLQLRAAAHIGPVEHDGHGFVGADVNFVFRLLEARPLRRAVAESGAELGLVVSDYVYRSLICRYPSLVAPDALKPVRFQVRRTRTRAWVYLPGPSSISTVPDADGAAELRPGLLEADSELKFPAQAGTPSQQIHINESATAEDIITGTPSQLVCDLRR